MLRNERQSTHTDQRTPILNQKKGDSGEVKLFITQGFDESVDKN